MMLKIKTELEGVMLHEIIHPMAPGNAVVFLVVDAARARVGAWSIVEEKGEKEECEGYLLFNGRDYYIAVASSRLLYASVFTCQIDGTDDDEEAAGLVSRALDQVFGEVVTASAYSVGLGL